MAWGFLDWVRGRSAEEAADKLGLSTNPSRREIRDLLLLLPSDPPAFDVYRLLDSVPERARPLLEELFRDDARFRSMEGEVRGWALPPLDVMLTILVRWHSDFAIRELQGMVGAADPALRAIAGRLLASTGRAEYAPMLLKLAADADLNVRDAVASGLSDASERMNGYELEDALALRLYDLMKACVLRTDAGLGSRFAEVLLSIDRERAIGDLTADDALTIDRTWLDEIMVALRKSGIAIPHSRVASLLQDGLAILNGPDFDPAEHSLLRYTLVELLAELAKTDLPAAVEHIRTLRQHAHKEGRSASHWARTRIFGDPTHIAYDARAAAGDPLQMRREHRVVLLVCRLDGEVCNGGWLQWVVNSSGQYAVETLSALREVGTEAAVAELQKIMDLLGPDGRHPNQRMRMKAIDRAMDLGAAFPEDSVIWRMSNELQELCFDYAEKHSDAFPRAGWKKRED